MPGIVGLVTSKPPRLAERELEDMVAAIYHESFYVTGTWVDEHMGIYVGWAAQKGSFSEQMPLRNERGDVTLVFSGDEFPEPGTASRLKHHKHKIDEHGRSYLVHHYEEDPAFPASLNGRFHGVLTDRSQGMATLFNDRYGMHRVYYHHSKEAFYFAAEAKAILRVCPDLRAMDIRGMGEFISCGCVLENRTLFRDLYVLPPASSWRFQNANLVRKDVYFQPRQWEEQVRLKEEAYYKELREVFTRNLPRYFNGRQRIGMSLTGGLDTRMIMAWHKAQPGTLPCYSFGGAYRECRDVITGRKVAQACGQSHQVIPVGDDFLSRFAHYAERAVYLTDGCAAVNRSADLYVNQLAREIAPIRMTGNYGGEVLRGIRAFKPIIPSPDLFHPDLVANANASTATYERQLEGHPLSFAVFRQAPWHHFGLLALEQTQLCLRSPYLDNDFVRTVYRAPQAAIASPSISLRLVADGDAVLARIPTDRGLSGTRGPLYSAVSRAWIELTAKAEYAYDYGMPQWVTKIDHSLSQFHLERLFLGRHKFSHFRVWYRDKLSGYVKEMLLDSRALSRPYLNRHRVESVVRGHLRGTRNYTLAIHTLLTLELLHRLFIDPEAVKYPPMSNP